MSSLYEAGRPALLAPTPLAGGLLLLRLARR
jgi:hypothetical protein